MIRDRDEKRAALADGTSDAHPAAEHLNALANAHQSESAGLACTALESNPRPLSEIVSHTRSRTHCSAQVEPPSTPACLTTLNSISWAAL